MSILSKTVLGACVALPLIALQGCAMLEGTTTAASPQTPSTTALGSGGSWFMRAGLQPFSVANCMKFDVTPPECERVIKGAE
jgi:hypothetical protein